MKKILVVFYISLTVGLIFAVVGGFMIDKAEVNMGQIYDILGENLQFGEKKVVFEQEELPEAMENESFTTDKTVTYPLNEFHTMELFAESCSVEFKPTDSDDMKISLDYPKKLVNKIFLRTAVKNGSLYVITSWTDESAIGNDVRLTVEIPENYKGGYSINGSGTMINLCDIDSSMDIAFNILSSTVNAKSLDAGEFTVELGSSTFNAERIVSRGSIEVLADSSTMNINNLNSSYTKLTASSSTVNLKNISGGITTDTQTSTLNCEFKSVSGNVSVTAETGSINIKIPHDSPVSLRHEESYSSFRDNIKWTDKNSKNKNSRYIIDTNVKFSIVTLDEK